MRPRHSNRRGISEVMATVLLVAVTLIAGAALFGYVNGQAANSENAIGGQVGGNINYLNERETITLVNFPDTSHLNIWVYNTGQLALSNFNILITGGSIAINCPAPTASPSTCTGAGCGSVTLSGQSTIAKSTPSTPAVPQQYSLTGCSFATGTPYTVTFQGFYGSSTSYTQSP
jgi:flagellin-like protein